MTVFQIANATTWWDYEKYPVISFGPVAFPAPILPILITFVFIFYKTYPGHGNGAANDQEQPERQLDENRNLGDAPADAPALERHAATILRFLHGFVSQHIIYRPETKGVHEVANPNKRVSNELEPLELWALCYTEALALIVEGYLLGPPEKQVSCTITSVGYLCFLFGRPDDLSDFCLVAVFALPCALEYRASNYGQCMAGTNLLALALDEYMSSQSYVREYKVLDVQVWRFALLFACATLGQVVGCLVRARSSDPAYRQPFFSNLWQLLSSDWLQCFQMLGVLPIYMGTLVLGAVVAGFLSSCLPWNQVLSGMPSKPPSIQAITVFLGFMFYVPAWCVVSELRRDLPRASLITRTWLAVLRMELRFNALVLGWTVTGIVALHLILRILDGNRYLAMLVT